MDIELQVGVKALLRNHEGNFLLVRESPEKYPEKGSIWDMPGGRIEPGVPYLDSLKREIKEETGLDLKKEVRLIAAQDILKVPGRHVIRLTFIGEIEGEPQISEDHTEFGWFDINEIRKMDNLDMYFGELIKYGAFDKTF